MKRLIALLTAGCLLFSAAAFAQESWTDYRSDFSAGTDGWYARSAGTASISVTDGALLITGREAAWNSPGRDFDLEPGKKYVLGVEVRQDVQASVDFMISVAHKKDGVESYENLVTATANKGRWTKLSGSWIPGQFDNYVLYVETKNHGTADFLIRNFTVELYEVQYDADIPSLKDALAPWFLFGTSVTQAEARDTRRMETYARQFGIFTPGNELKPDSVLDTSASRELAKQDDTAVAVRFDAAKPMLDFCMSHGIPVHGHVLVWHSQTPEAFFRTGYNVTKGYVSREVMLARLDNYVRPIMAYMQENYPGLIVSWDVVNEAVDDGTGGLRQSNWTKVVGDDFVERAFEIARKYAPEGTKLYYNDYNTPMAPKTDGIMALLERLVKEGNIDGYGFQAHYSATNPGPSKVGEAMERVEKMGLRIRISEMDITIKDDSDLEKKVQAIRYAALMKLFMEHKDFIDAVQVWGVCDDLSWLAKQYPLLFDERLLPKPAFWSIMELTQQ